DYGLLWNGQWHLNDYLAYEFRGRVGEGADIELIRSLVEALEQLNEPISEPEREAEKTLILEDRLKSTHDELVRRYSSGPDEVERALAAIQISPKWAETMDRIQAFQLDPKLVEMMERVQSIQLDPKLAEVMERVQSIQLDPKLAEVMERVQSFQLDP